MPQCDMHTARGKDTVVEGSISSTEASFFAGGMVGGGGGSVGGVGGRNNGGDVTGTGNRVCTCYEDCRLMPCAVWE